MKYVAEEKIPDELKQCLAQTDKEIGELLEAAED